MEENSKEFEEWKQKVNSQLSIVDRNYFNLVKHLYEIIYKIPELGLIKNQILLCITFGLYLAAMTLTNHLLEQFLKFTLIYKDSLNKKDKINFEKEFALPEELEKSNIKFVQVNLGKNIVEAKNQGLINDDQMKILNNMKDDFRNAYSHGDRAKMHKEQSIFIEEIKGDKAVEDLLMGITQPKREFKKSNLPQFEFLFSNDHAESNCLQYILQLNEIIVSVESKLYKNS